MSQAGKIWPLQPLSHLIFDADDTLWENNRYYEDARLAFIRLGSTVGITAENLDRNYLQTENDMVLKFGYGSKNFIRILDKVFRDNFSGNGDEHIRRSYDEILRQFHTRLAAPMQLLPGVSKVLPQLRSKFRLHLLTKGELEEQQRKVDRSELRPHFENVFIRTEKNIEVYRSIIDGTGWDVGTCCMIGNSPRSDINPALQTGMHAVYIPYKYTWNFDTEPFPADHPRLRIVNSFSELSGLFPVD